MKIILLKIWMMAGMSFFIQQAQAQNLLADGNFSSTTAITPYITDPPTLHTWYSWVNPAYIGPGFTSNISNGVCSYSWRNVSVSLPDVQLIQWGFPLLYGHHYRLSFDIMAEKERDLGVFIGENTGTGTNLNAANYIQHATTVWQTRVIEFDAITVFALNKLSFEMGIEYGTVYLKNISLVDAGIINAPAKVVIAGNFQRLLGCTYTAPIAGHPDFATKGDWEPTCDKTALKYQQASGRYCGSFRIPAGCYQYRVAVNGSIIIGQDGVEGGSNMYLYIPKDTLVTFTYNPTTRIVTTSPFASGITPNCETVILAGGFQHLFGCADYDLRCNKTALTFNAISGNWEGDFTLAPGCYIYYAVVNNDWSGIYGLLNIDPGYFLISIPEKPTKVHFEFDPVTHVLSCLYNAWGCQPNTVYVAGNFQAAIGCSSNWQPDCNKTKMRYDPATKSWLDTLDIPAGNWQYKIVQDPKWNGGDAEEDGNASADSIPLVLPASSKVVFHFLQDNIAHYVYTEIISTGISLNKFYDTNVNGYSDNEEQPIAGVTFTLTGTHFKQTQTTGSDGKAFFSNVPNGRYLLKEKIPHGYLFTTPASQLVDINNSSTVANFGNVCLGSGGAREKEYWTGKRGEEKLIRMGMERQLRLLRNLNLRNKNSSDFDPYSYKQLRKWMKEENKRNIAYSLSVQMAVMYLNLQAGFVDTGAIIHAPGFGNIGINNNFNRIYSLVYRANASLGTHPITKEKVGDHKNQAHMLYGLWRANANLNFIQQQPCSWRDDNGGKKENPVVATTADVVAGAAVIVPNPTNNYFTLRLANNGNNGPVQLRVFDANGRLVYHRSSNKDQRFGDHFTSGLYYVEVIQGSNRFTYKVIKQ